jgi:hypothetical protein
MRGPRQLAEAVPPCSDNRTLCSSAPRSASGIPRHNFAASEQFGSVGAGPSIAIIRSDFGYALHTLLRDRHAKPQGIFVFFRFSSPARRSS